MSQWKNCIEESTPQNHLYKKHTSIRREQNVYSETLKKIRKRWKDLTPKEELLLIFDTVINKSYSTVTLVLSHDFAEKISGLNEKQALDLVRRRFNVNFRNNFGYLPRFLFLLEGYDTDCLHLHGVIKLKSDMSFFPVPNKKLAHVLKRTAFGPRYQENPMSRNILRLEQVYAPKCWLRYITKDFKNNKKEIYGKFYVCQELRREAKRAYEKMLPRPKLKIIEQPKIVDLSIDNDDAFIKSL